MPLNEKVFDDQIRFVIERPRRRMSAADLLRLLTAKRFARANTHRSHCTPRGLGLSETTSNPASRIPTNFARASIVSLR
jgi:hypothetical protein